MMPTKAKERSPSARLASVQKEMGKPRIARSAKIAMLDMDTSRKPEHPSTSMPGIVDKIIPSPRPSQPEKAQIGVSEADHGHRDLRITNTLTNEHGNDVKLKKGARVEVTVTAEPETSSRSVKQDSQPTRRGKSRPNVSRHNS
jgi:hypothetical protein